ncbi:metalloregulator ArsR/SmtB family transcription factor [Paenarthrobacter sp. PH39-S1]|uniref:ArsR/SmtB family transcription factor n=1 Tax=Paenarthrobacter sp. PH39-S1 TaxID=3046204 RepID=UPI0024BA50D1|nr:metalloregulator ArsR/SmtB family transcription factor [Paenarthrobacter sp. PH39-S1]MDJ0356668.1 metalloregulator ArsR/SmtB family transcription factor [Paenarthrobacter sp. PH39-S1]
MTVSQPTVFGALADPTRLTIVDMLAKRGELSASAISSVFSVSPSAISQHLKVLREAGLVLVKKQAQQRIYRLDTATIGETQRWLAERTVQWNARLDAMESYIERINEGVEDGK